jgi:hypothetical protein
MFAFSIASALRQIALCDAKLGQAEVALDRDHALEAVLAPEFAQLVELADRFRANQHVDRALALLQQ